MKQTLLSVNLRGLRGVHAVMLLTFLSLFMSLGASAQSIIYPTTVTGLPLAQDGPWMSSSKTGYYQSGLVRDANENLNNISSGNSATFDSQGDHVIIRFDSAPDSLNYYARTTGTWGGGQFIVSQSIDGSTYTPLINNALTSIASKYKTALNPLTRYVKFTYSTKGGGNVLLDGIRVNPAPFPEINVKQGNDNFGGAVNSAAYQFGDPNTFTTTESTFTIENTKSGTLNISSIVLGGKNADQFAITSQNISSIAGNGQANLTIVYNPTLATPKDSINKATITIISNDEDEPNYVINLSGTAVSPITELYLPDGFEGETISIKGTDLLQVTSVQFNGVNATSFEVISDNEVQAVVPAGATTGKVTVSPSRGAVATSPDEFIIWSSEPPVVTSFNYQSGGIGTLLTITGENFTSYAGAYMLDKEGNQVTLDGLEFISTTELRGMVPAGAVTGKLFVNDILVSNVPSSGDFIVSKINNVTPPKGTVGTAIAVTGDGITGNIESVTINGRAATITPVANGFTTQIPTGATEGDGLLVINTLGGGVTSTPFTVEPTPDPLPVELVNFNATPTNAGAKLSWQTASEQNNAYFEVQSTNNLKSGEFKTLGRVITKDGNSNILLSYEFLDATVARGTTVYYRLKQVDTDGTFEYSKVVSVNIKQAAKGKGLVNVYPNPFKEQINLEVEAEKAGSIIATLYDARGYKVFARSITIEAGVSAVTVDLPANLRTGLYFLTTQVEGNTKTTRLIKE